MTKDDGPEANQSTVPILEIKTASLDNDKDDGGLQGSINTSATDAPTANAPVAEEMMADSVTTHVENLNPNNPNNALVSGPWALMGSDNAVSTENHHSTSVLSVVYHDTTLDTRYTADGVFEDHIKDTAKLGGIIRSADTHIEAQYVTDQSQFAAQVQNEGGLPLPPNLMPLVNMHQWPGFNSMAFTDWSAVAHPANGNGFSEVAEAADEVKLEVKYLGELDLPGLGWKAKAADVVNQLQYSDAKVCVLSPRGNGAHQPVIVIESTTVHCDPILWVPSSADGDLMVFIKLLVAGGLNAPPVVKHKSDVVQLPHKCSMLPPLVINEQENDEHILLLIARDQTGNKWTRHLGFADTFIWEYGNTLTSTFGDHEGEPPSNPNPTSQADRIAKTHILTALSWDTSWESMMGEYDGTDPETCLPHGTDRKLLQ
ncbi:hypothetical protein NEOLEDRAFT_1151604 [Neolentinus lepideus HHB14362 ss-1]|uniref:Uncharacterized protein n=1 Tax=Neolentinus lepideus HHB14362 ss-1 TaxID=1314782 RepID=A0A165NSS1_9AGAM|nr:hypothetical protein NEOLEDRAFT_1151604 [Neolentinus lepideus HHB14362 ss-1]